MKIFVNLIEQGNLISADMTSATVMYADVKVRVNMIIFRRNIGAVSTVLSQKHVYKIGCYLTVDSASPVSQNNTSSYVVFLTVLFHNNCSFHIVSSKFFFITKSITKHL